MRYVLSLLLLLASVTGGVADGPIAPDGRTAVQIDLPLSLRLKNRGGSDGAGLCVFTSIAHAARYQGESRLVDLQAYMTAYPGGSWPEKTDRILARYAPSAPYLQVTGASADFLKMVLQNGYMPSVTWGGNHMLNLVYLDDKLACILDNNSPYGKGPNGERTDTALQWMSAAKFLKHASVGGGIWCVVLLDKGPPSPIPCGAWDDWDWLSDPFPRYEWWTDERYPGDLYLYEDGFMIGGYRGVDKTYHPYYPKRPEGQRFGRTCPPPCAVPLAEGKTGCVGRVPDYGVTWGMPAGAKPRYTRNGKVITETEAWAAIQDRAKMLRATVIGTPEFRAKVLADISTAFELSPWKGKLLLQDYPPDSPLAADVGLTPGVTVQLPPGPDGKGKVVHRQADYSGAADLAAALRRADPTYNPNAAPDQRKPAPVAPVTPAFMAGGVDASPVLPLGLAGIMSLLAMYFSRKEKTQWPLS